MAVTLRITKTMRAKITKITTTTKVVTARAMKKDDQEEQKIVTERVTIVMTDGKKIKSDDGQG